MSAKRRTPTSDRGQPGVGFGNPPAASRFKPGQSGNAKGRPKGSRNALPYDAVLGQHVTVREGGRERRVSAAEAFLLQMAGSGLAGDGAAGRSALAAIETARGLRAAGGADRIREIRTIIVDVGTANGALRALGMATKLDPLRDTARMMIEPWLVQAALARLGERRLSLEEQVVVARATRTPNKVKWPEWWGT